MIHTPKHQFFGKATKSLGKQQKEVLAAVEAMQRHPLRNWDGKYDAAVTQVQQNSHKLESMRSLYQQKVTQLEQWSKQGQTYQSWNKEEQTVDMKLLSGGLNTPQIQERLATALQQSQQKQSQLTGGQQRGDRGQGLSV